MAASAEFSRLLIQGIQWDAQDANITLYVALKAAARAKLSLTDKGRYLIGTTGNGKSVSFQLPPLGRGQSSEELAEATYRLVELYEASKASLIAGGIAAPTDEQIVAEIKARLQPVRSYRVDFVGLRTGPQATETEVAL